MVSHLETSIDPIFLPGGGGGGDTMVFNSTLQIKVLLGCYLATNSFGLGRLFYKSSCQPENSRCHGD